MGLELDREMPGSRRIAALLITVPMVMIFACRESPRSQETTGTQGPPVAINTPKIYPSPIFDHPYQGTGVVMTINVKEGWIGIKHEEIKGLMPAMEMEFWVSSRSLLNSIKPGDKIDFTIVETRKGEYITEIKNKSRLQ